MAIYCRFLSSLLRQLKPSPPISQVHMAIIARPGLGLGSPTQSNPIYCKKISANSFYLRRRLVLCFDCTYLVQMICTMKLNHKQGAVGCSFQLDDMGCSNPISFQSVAPGRTVCHSPKANRMWLATPCENNSFFGFNSFIYIPFISFGFLTCSYLL